MGRAVSASAAHGRLGLPQVMEFADAGDLQQLLKEPPGDRFVAGCAAAQRRSWKISSIDTVDGGCWGADGHVLLG